jgi:predicted TIM-barrel fold metal-dependent hydrolase
VFKAHVQVGGYDPRDPYLDPVWGLLAEAGIPVVAHCGNGPVPTQFTGPDIFAEVMARHPRLPAVVAHLGMPDFAEFLDLAGRYPRMRLDTTTVFTDFGENVWPFPRDARSRLADLGDRIMFGSDFPTIPYRYAEAVAGLVRLDLGSDWLRAVFHDNAVALWPEPTRT